MLASGASPPQMLSPIVAGPSAGGGPDAQEGVQPMQEVPPQAATAAFELP